MALSRALPQPVHRLLPLARLHRPAPVKSHGKAPANGFLSSDGALGIAGAAEARQGDAERARFEASLVLSDEGRDIYFVKIESERFGPYWAEMGEDANSHDAVLKDLIDGQHDDAVEIICVRADGSWAVASEEFALAWLEDLLAHDEFEPECVPALIERHLDWTSHYQEHEDNARAELGERISFLRRR